MQEGTTDQRGRSHPSQRNTLREDRQIIHMAVTNRSVTSRNVAQNIECVTLQSVSARTIRRRLQQSGLSTRRPLHGLPLMQNHRRLHRQWCGEKGCGWQNGMKLSLLTSDAFGLQHHDGRIPVWKHHGERMLNSCVMHRHTGPAPVIMVWDSIGYHSRTPLVRIAGEFARRPHDACSSPRYDSGGMDYITLVAPSATVFPLCPHLVETDGLRIAANKNHIPSDQCQDSAVKVVGCRSHETLEFLSTCETVREHMTFQCQGTWEENGRNYLIAGLKGSKVRYCFVYYSNPKMTQFSGLPDTCRRTIVPGVTGNLTFNITSAVGTVIKEVLLRKTEFYRTFKICSAPLLAHTVLH
ncbi:uncharacterized protein TNCV_78901 [Trichonephila clavipes]|nr:uncharacterized protein TNCV_78901 [Trichonephila clavipes]